ELRDSLLALFLRFLRQCPQLTRLEITRSAFSSHPPSRLPGGLLVDVIPLLCSFKGPRLLAAFFVSDRPLWILELEEGRSFGRGRQPSPEDVISDLVEISYSTAGLQTFTFCIPMRAALQLCRTVAVHWPNLRDLCFVLNETPLPHPPRGPFMGNNNHFDDDSDDESSVDVDDRDVDFSDNGSSDSVRTRGSYRLAFNFSPTAEVPFPDVLAPGHMYTKAKPSNNCWLGLTFCQAKAKSTPIPGQKPWLFGFEAKASESPGFGFGLASDFRKPKPWLSGQAKARIRVQVSTAMRPRLQRYQLPAPMIRIRSWTSWIVSASGVSPSPHLLKCCVLEKRTGADIVHHRVVLALEAQLPALREVDFGRYSTWWRYRNTWRPSRSGAKIASLYHV
ncbi:hypothetical protein DFH08DRAFT_1044083, partial [Mycena albidolilacea]